MKSSLYGFAAALLGFLPLLTTGCNTDAFCFTCGEDNVIPDAGSQGGSGGMGGGQGGDGGDIFVGVSSSGSGGSGGMGGNDCMADTQTDAKNCGQCGFVCELLGAFPKCVAGQCQIESCAVGYIDLNGLQDDGCEYVCTESNNGVEICDGADNDCNGQIDEGFDLTSDINNCGACGVVCAIANATAECKVVAGFPTCVIAACDPGQSNLDGLSANGCEYTCPVFPSVAEVCNGLDDDCDGTVNENNPGGGMPCESSCPGGVCQGECTPGTTLCGGATLVCVPGKGPSLELCDGKDNDCDGAVDNGFDFQNDPLNCGNCGNVCMLANAVGGCQMGQCVISACLPGYASIDGDTSTGCEYQCPLASPTLESCNGIDDDCNGIIDDAVSIAPQRPPSLLCYPNAGTPCAGASFVCTGTGGWKCNYGPGVEVSADGTLAVAEAKCDGIDGNCNGQIDESFTDLGTECDNGLLGACRDAGERICDPNDQTTTFCDLSVLPDPTPGAPSLEACNGIDDDCNGPIDDGITDDMVVVQVGAQQILMDRYEASRPDATASSAGLNETRRCVTPLVLPWTLASQAEAAAACAKTGQRLCTELEMEAACAGPMSRTYPYGNTYQSLTCNGLDYDGIPGGVDNNVLLPTGSSSFPNCVSSLGIYDLSGNATEWTSTQTGTTGAPLNIPIYMAKGGSYLTPASGLACGFDLSRFAANAILPELGFRCCQSIP